MQLVSVQTGQPRTFEAGSDATVPWTSAIWKEPVEGAVWVGSEGLAGDAQANRRVHGGPERAILLYPLAHYRLWAAEWGLKSLGPGGFGENLTVAGLDETTVCVGDIYQLGEVRVEVSGPREPCQSLARRHGVPGLVERVLETGRAGWYARVRNEGLVEAGLGLVLLDRPYPQWPIRRALAVKADRARRKEETELLAACPALLADWRAKLVGSQRPGKASRPA